jgi:hypothetical protein
MWSVSLLISRLIVMSVYMHGSDNHIFFQHLQIQENDITYASCSFEVILNQAMYHLCHYKWKYGGPCSHFRGNPGKKSCY